MWGAGGCSLLMRRWRLARREKRREAGDVMLFGALRMAYDVGGRRGDSQRPTFIAARLSDHAKSNQRTAASTRRILREISSVHGLRMLTRPLVTM